MIRALPSGVVAGIPGVVTAPTQLGGIPVVRVAGLLALLAMAAGLLALALWNAEVREPAHEDEDDDGGLFNPGPAYGATGTTDVTEVLQVEPEAEDGTQRADDGDRDSPDRGHGAYRHEVLGERTRGYLVAVNDGDASAEFFVRGVESADPSVDPASVRDRRHGEEWTREARRYLRERAVEGDLLADVERE